MKKTFWSSMNNGLSKAERSEYNRFFAELKLLGRAYEEEVGRNSPPMSDNARAAFTQLAEQMNDIPVFQ